ncbi:Fur-regulated basic protein FbpA [Heyndrickxia ginsengihumi]|uniref:Fur-regulated basic protein FbpA n=1 Tax=Heyndrickxia ginsengihumi TaxID=363870 RepID=A0A0A6VE63_9BACI|nr:Fur-regulated basic protein FbpA [Heyndrickxia ginsengihumi]KHD85861.1 hisitidine kinase [Heyndrickxia ginsengihumi]MBE6185004.1 Fur-regulated basic protein FbpA [Bacillus sp. (in: firmicutes)]NEY21225.1 Fur-regulated basic protein FbpA [Heyndrickxia ginsengihumi]
MGNLLRKSVELKKSQLIHKLLDLGVYKKYDKQLYELPLTVLEKEYQVMKGVQNN